MGFMINIVMTSKCISKEINDYTKIVYIKNNGILTLQRGVTDNFYKNTRESSSYFR